MSAIAIREMTDADGAAVLAIYDQGIQGGNATFESEVPLWEYWSAARLPAPRLVAVADEEVAGWAALSAYSSRPVYRGVAEVGVYVADAAQGRGTGKALLARLVADSEAAGFWTLQAGIFPENVASLAVHEQCGFVRVGVRAQIGLAKIGPYAGRWRDVVLLERRSARVGV
ncbi:MAG: GNAT family N-acetyltransferase [Maricaulaceae bacterium]|jgi:phosphinothricin acetyltransferase